MQLKSFLSITLILSVCQVTFGQATKSSTLNSLSELKKQFEKKKINDTVYLEKVNMLLRTNIGQGVSFSNKEMQINLSFFREITWSDQRFSSYKRTYYGLLANQAQMANRGGEMLYYAEKLDSWERETYKRPSLAALSLIADYHKTHKSYTGVKELYIKHSPYLNQIPQLVQSQTLSSVETVQAFMLLDKMSEALCESQDVITVNNMYNLSTLMFQQVQQQTRFNIDERAFIRFSLLRITYNRGAVKHDSIIQRKAIADMVLLAKLKGTPETILYYAEKSVFELEIDYYTKHLQPDSALYYIQKYKQRDGFPENSDTKYFALYYKALNEINSGAYKKGAETMKEANLIQENSTIDALKDVDQILYSQTEAEEKKIELVQAGKMVKNRTRLAVIIFLLSVLVITTILIYFYIDKKQTQKRLKVLNDSVHKQVSMLEDLRLTTIKKERERISRNIHDNLSPNLVSIIHQIELLTYDTADKNASTALTSLKEQAKDSYNSLRNLSHSIFAETEEIGDLQFERRIKKMVNKALPDKYFKKEIQISPDIVHYLNIDTRIELLRIAQEAITNVIKHASAKAISILLYEDGAEAIFNINDNGKGFNVTNSSLFKGKMGLSSMRKRARICNGTFTIKSGKEGTNIEIKFPLEKMEKKLVE